MKKQEEIGVRKKVESDQRIIIDEKNAEIFHLKNIIENLPGSIYWKNTEGVYLYRNAASAESMRSLNFPWQWNEIIGKTDHDLFSKATADKFREHDLYVINTGKELIQEETLTLPSGERIIQLSRKRPLMNENGKIVGIIGNTIDITYLKKVETELCKAKNVAESANNAKTEFLENMRHDIRTPLSGIIGLSELLKNEKDINKIKKYTIELAESSKELLRFLNEILESINIASGDIPLLQKKFNLKTIFENIVKLHLAKACEKQLKLEFHFDEMIPKYLIGDPVRIYRITLELVSNALKFTKEGHINIFVTLAKKNEQNLVIKIEVEDTGSGIPTEKQQELFVRFKRLTPSFQGIYKGAGLGLSIVKQFIDDLQGEIYYDSDTSKGAKFICLLPIKESLLEDALGEDNDALINLSTPL